MPLKAKQKELKRQRKGNRPKATTALSDKEIDILYSKKVLGLSSPQALVNTVWLNIMLHFGLRGCKEQRELRWGDVVLKVKQNNTLSSLLNGKQRLELEKTRGINVKWSRVCIKTKPPSLLNETPFRFSKPTKISAQKTCWSQTLVRFYYQTQITVRFRITFCEINVYLHSAEVF